MKNSEFSPSVQAVVDQLAAQWDGSGPILARWADLPAWSTVVTRRGLLFCPIGRHGARLVGVGAYILDDGTPHHWGTWSSFLGDRWQKVLALPAFDYTSATGERGALIDGLGRLAGVGPEDAAFVVSARSHDVLRRSAPALRRVASSLQVPISTLGVYGSTLYKHADLRSDFDFIVYGEAESRRAYAGIVMRLAESDSYVKEGIAYHLRFQLPGSTTWYDPRFWRREEFTAALVGGDCRMIGSEDIDHLEVTEDRYGIFTPSVYGLADDTCLLSHRLGHAAYLRKGDRISAFRIPLYEIGRKTYRVVLDYQDLTRDRSL
ncbi:MAG TPA: hypothetical protein VGM10_31380 [Actinocrinis sp.]|jgi:hypothetical protein